MCAAGLALILFVMVESWKDGEGHRRKGALPLQNADSSIYTSSRSNKVKEQMATYCPSASSDWIIFGREKIQLQGGCFHVLSG